MARRRVVHQSIVARGENIVLVRIDDAIIAGTEGVIGMTGTMTGLGSAEEDQGRGRGIGTLSACGLTDIAQDHAPKIIGGIGRRVASAGVTTTALVDEDIMITNAQGAHGEMRNATAAEAGRHTNTQSPGEAALIEE